MTLSRRSILFVAFTVLAVVSLRAQTPPSQAGASAIQAPVAEPPTTRITGPLEAYAAVGSSLAINSRLRELGWSDEQFAAFLEGVRAGFRGNSYPLAPESKQLFAEMAQRLAAVDAEAKRREFAEPGRIEKYMKETCAQYRLQRSDSGLGFGVMEGGKGVRPSPEDRVVFSMTANADDATTEIPQLGVEKLRVKVADLMPGLVEGMQLMTIGSRAMFIVPPDLSYGDGKWPAGVVRGTPIIFVVSLHEVIPEVIEP